MLYGLSLKDVVLSLFLLVLGLLALINGALPFFFLFNSSRNFSLEQDVGRGIHLPLKTGARRWEALRSWVRSGRVGRLKIRSLHSYFVKNLVN